MKRFAWAALLVPTILVTLLVSPLSSAHAAAQKNVTASAVIVPARVSSPSFTLSAMLREIPVQEGEKVQAGQTLAVLDTPELEYAVAAAEAAFHKADLYAYFQSTHEVKVIRRGRTYFEPLPNELWQIADARADQARAVWDAAQAALAQATLVAPFDSTVVTVNVTPGEFVQAGQRVLTLASLDEMQIETTDLSERDIARVKIGQTATVFIEALNRRVTARVIAIAPRAETLGGDVIFRVTLALDEQPDGLRWGMTAEVEIAVK